MKKSNEDVIKIDLLNQLYPIIEDWKSEYGVRYGIGLIDSVDQ